MGSIQDWLDSQGEGSGEASKILKELAVQSDRHVAIIGAALVEDQLAEAIKGRLVQGNIQDKLGGQTVEQRLLRGPLSNFSAKIDFAYALGIISRDFFGDLHQIRNIRNEFAHFAKSIGFETQNVTDRCAQLWSPANLSLFGDDSSPHEPREQYLTAIILLYSALSFSMLGFVDSPEPSM